MSACVEQTKLDSDVSADVMGCVDTLENNTVFGWVISLTDKPVEINLIVKGKLCEATIERHERTDVTEQHGVLERMSGFSLAPRSPEIDLNSIENPSTTIDILANGVKLKWQEGQSVNFNQRVSNVHKSALLGSYVDRVDDFVIKGWVLTEDRTDCNLMLLVNGNPVDCMPIRVERADVAKVYGSKALNSGFEIYLPGCIWELVDDSGICNLSIMANESSVNSSPIMIEYDDITGWIDSLISREPSNDTDHLALFALEHVRYARIFKTLPEHARKFLEAFASRMHLLDYLYSEQAHDGDCSSQMESVSTIMLREAMHELNTLMKSADDEVYPLIRRVYKKYSLRGTAKEWYLNLAVQLTCASGEFDKLAELTDFNYLDGLQTSHQPHQLALLLPVLASNAEVEKATEIMRLIAKNIENSWLPSECIAFAVNVVNRLEQEGRVDIHVAERFRIAYVNILDGFKAGWFSRLHDEQLVSTMVSILANVEFYTDYHKRDIISAAMRLYGLNPVFWRMKDELRLAKLNSELATAQSSWESLKKYFDQVDTASQEIAAKAFEAIDYFRSKGNGEVVMLMREVAVNLIHRYRFAQSEFPHPIIQRLIATDHTETLRVIAHPASSNIDETKKYFGRETDVMHGLRGHSDYHKSAVYDMQHSVSEAVTYMHQMIDLLAGTERQNVIKRFLFDIERKSALLGTWQGMFLGVDMLISAYQMGMRFGCRPVSFLMNAMEMIRMAVRECDVQHTLAAPICASLSRIADTRGDANLKCFIGEVRGLVTEKFGDRYEGLFVPVNNNKTSGEGFGWPQDTLVVIDTTREELDRRCESIRKTWLQDLVARRIPYLFVVGGAQSTSLEGDLLELAVPEKTECRAEKIIKTYEWILKHLDVQYVVKVSDRCFLGVERYFDSLSYRKYHYYGKIMRCAPGAMDRQWHKDLVEGIHSGKCLDKSPANIGFVSGKFACSVSAFAMKELCDAAASEHGERIFVRTFSEDKLMGELLALKQITPSDEDFDVYTDTPILHELVPNELHANAFIPGRLTPAKIARFTQDKNLVSIQNRFNDNSVWPKRIWPTCQKPSLKPNSNQLELLTDTSSVEVLLKENVVVVCVVRNERLMLPHFLSHYRGLGAKCFIFVDNCSDDGTREYLLFQEDTVVYSSDTEYKNSHYGVSWQQAVMGNHCLGKWVLLADADEFLVYQNSENIPLKKFISGIESTGNNGVMLYMVDMYPYGDLDEARFDEKPVFEVAPYFDKNALIELRFGGGMYSNSKNYVNGLRHRLAPARINAYVSQKYALFKYYPWVRLCEGAHYAANMSVSEQSAFFAHFKYHSGFKEKVALEVKRKQHYNGAEEYQKYASMMAEMSGGFGVDGVSERYIDSQSFVRLVNRLNENEQYARQ